MPFVKVRVGSLLHSYTGGVSELEVEADVGTAAGVLAALDRRFPGLRFRVVDEQGRVREHVSVFLGEERLRDLDGAVPPGSEMYIVGALSGG